MKAKKIVFAVMIAVLLAACGKKEKTEVKDEDRNVGSETVAENSETEEKKEISNNEDYFEWSTTGNSKLIIGLTDKGKKQKELVIPAECEGITGAFEDSAVECITFEDDDDISISCAFSEAPNLRTVVLPAHLTEIGDYAFHSANKIESIIIPSEVETIGFNAFGDMKGLQEVVFTGNKLKTIGTSAFEDSEVIQTIELPEGLETIEKKAFKDCKSLNTLVIPVTVRTIGSRIIENTSVSELHLPEKIELPDLPIDAFSNFYPGKMCTVYIVKDSWMDQNTDWQAGDTVTVAYEQ